MSAYDAESGLTVAAGLDSLPIIKAALDEALARHTADPEFCQAFQLAVDEACANIIEYAFPPGEPGRLDLRFAREGNSFVVRISDNGAPFDPRQAREPDLDGELEERQPGGLGIFFIRQLMDELAYEVRGGQEILTLKKKLP